MGFSSPLNIWYLGIIVFFPIYTCLETSALEHQSWDPCSWYYAYPIHLFNIFAQVRRSLKLRSRRKEKEKEKLPSGITADYSANFFRDLNRDTLPSPNGYSPTNQTATNPVDTSDTNQGYANLPSQSNFTSQATIQQRALPLPPLPPRAIKKPNIKSNYRHSISTENLDPSKGQTSSHGARGALRPSSSLAFSEDATDFVKPTSPPEDATNFITPSLQVTNYDKNLRSPSVESLTDSTTNSSFATPPFSSSPVGEGQGYYSKFAVVMLNSSPEDMVNEFPLPDIEPTNLPEPRELNIPRRSSKNDFGFSLRRVMTVDRTSGVSQLRSVVLAEANALDESAMQIGLLPGDQLLEVNGVPVSDKTRDEIVDLVKSSESSVVIKVRI